MPEVMKIIRAELGSDAVILNSKVIHTGGFLGLFKKRNIEVLAAIDPVIKDKVKPILKEKLKIPVPNHTIPLKEEKKEETETFLHTFVEKPNDELMKEITQLKDILKNSTITNSGKGLALPIPIQEVQKNLLKQEIDNTITEELISSLVEKWYLKGAKATRDEVFLWAKEYLIKELAILSFGEILFNKKFVNIVGPTGVGKTTTLAKIAAECVLKYRKKVAFFTTDTYRIGAIEQLKTYANIINVPLEVCYNLDDFEKLASKYQEEYDIILVDTAGRNFRNQKYVEDLKKVIDYDKDMETLLVLSLTAKQADMEEIYNQFSLLEIDKFIFTKADETSSFGAMLNLMIKYKKGAAYLTTGQNVPDDMIAANPEAIVSRIIGVE